MGCLALVGAAYLVTRTRCLTEDSVDYACAVVKGGVAQLLHPHHLLYNPLLALISRGFLNGSADLHSLAFLQILNISISLVSLTMLALVLNELAFSLPIQLWSILTFAFAHGFWLYSSEIEVYNGATLCLLGATYCLLHETRMGRKSILGPLFVLLGMLFHQTLIFFCLALGIHAVATLGPRNSRSRLIRYVGIPLAAVGLCYVAATLVTTGSMTPHSVLEFMTSYAHSGWWGEFRGNAWWLGLRGLIDSLLSVEALKRLAALRPWLVVEIVVAALVPVFLIRATRSLSLDGPRRSCLLLFGLWFLFHSLFVVWWYPDNIEFWIIPLPAMVVAAATFLEGSWQRRRKEVAAAVSVLLLFEILVNASQWRQGCEDTTKDETYAMAVCARAKDSDLVLTTGQGALGSWLRYFCSAPVVSIHGYFGMKNPGPDEDIAKRLITALDPQLRVVVSRGGRVWIDASLWQGTVTRNRDLAHFNVEEFEAWLRSYTTEEESVGSDVVVLLYKGP